MSATTTDRAMTGLAFVRIGNGLLAWFAPRSMNRVFGVPREDESPTLIYMNRIFGVRAIALGVGYLASRGDARNLWHRLWLLCDAADTVMGAGMASRGDVPPAAAAKALLLTGGATAVDVAAMRAPKKPAPGA
jgi:hypothetical protein